MRIGRQVIASKERFSEFLEEKFKFRCVTPIMNTASLRKGVNRFYCAETSDGRKIFIKATSDAHLAYNEYWANEHLHALNPDNFAEAIAYYSSRPYAFCATEFVEGTPLLTYIENNALSDADKINIIENVYRIFCTMKKGDVVHRDLHLNQMIYDGVRLKLIDFQYAASKSHYVETAYKKIYLVVDKQFKYKRFAWDDSYDFLLLMGKFECPESFLARFDEIKREMAAHVGKETIYYKLPSVWIMSLHALYCNLMRKLVFGSKKIRYENKYHKCKKIITEIRELQACEEKY